LAALLALTVFCAGCGTLTSMAKGAALDAFNAERPRLEGLAKKAGESAGVQAAAAAERIEYKLDNFVRSKIGDNPITDKVLEKLDEVKELAAAKLEAKQAQLEAWATQQRAAATQSPDDMGLWLKALLGTTGVAAIGQFVQQRTVATAEARKKERDLLAQLQAKGAT